MSRMSIPAREDAPAVTQPLLDAVQKQLGVVPNLFRLVALSPAVLQGYLGFSGALAKTLDCAPGSGSRSPWPRSMVVTTACRRTPISG
jgi:hypothetical protein